MSKSWQAYLDYGLVGEDTINKERAVVIKATPGPQITAFSEYGFEKNGLRFPSRSFTENASIKKDKQKFVNAEISIRYKNYKFFTVETEIKY